MSLNFRPEIAKVGSSQKGCTKSFQALPNITAIEVLPTSAPSILAASIMKGPWIVQWPPADGAKKLIKNELTNPQNGSVWVVEISTNHFAIVVTKSEPPIIPMMPA